MSLSASGKRLTTISLESLSTRSSLPQTSSRPTRRQPESLVDTRAGQPSVATSRLGHTDRVMPGALLRRSAVPEDAYAARRVYR